VGLLCWVLFIWHSGLRVGGWFLCGSQTDILRLSLPALPAGSFIFCNLPATCRQDLTFDRVAVVKAFVPEPHRRRDDVVLGHFAQRLGIETKLFLYKFCAVENAILQDDRVLHAVFSPVMMTDYI
jgi:hypothetical protein